jgi:LmbE family N-acetylglucosaminyl deacetylase
MATIVAFHAHPDDEVLLTGGTLARLADVLRAERADVLLSYDPQGGYFHRDHIRVHEVGARAAELTGARVLEATAPRELLRLLFMPVWLARLVVRHEMSEIWGGGTPSARITHRVSVARYARQKRAALAAHSFFTRSQGRSARLGRVLIALPVPVFAMVLGREWLAEPAA